MKVSDVTIFPTPVISASCFARILFLILLTAPGAAQTSRDLWSCSAASFNAECTIEHQTSLPQRALEAIVTSPLSKSVLEDCANFDSAPSDISSSWFEATEVNVDGHLGSGLLVRGNHDCLHGAHIVQFWILAKSGSSYKTLFTARADAITILRTHTGGYSDLELTFIYGAGATIEKVRLRYTQGSYKVASRRTKHN